uniref:PGG domain-containing protein n=1 Tax=Arundo donax TaxID=35708 RepID=A0A0A8ZYW6_ARUDO
MADENQAGGSANDDGTNSNALQESQNKKKSREEREQEDREYLNEMRGWLVTVATLFVGMTYQAAMQPPAWMPKPEEWSRMLFAKGARGSRTLAHRAAAYQFFNTMTFSSALTILVLLLVMDGFRLISARRILLFVRMMAAFLSSFVAVNFVIGITNVGRATFYLVGIMVSYIFLVSILCLVAVCLSP